MVSYAIRSDLLCDTANWAYNGSNWVRSIQTKHSKAFYSKCCFLIKWQLSRLNHINWMRNEPIWSGRRTTSSHWSGLHIWRNGPCARRRQRASACKRVKQDFFFKYQDLHIFESCFLLSCIQTVFRRAHCSIDDNVNHCISSLKHSTVRKSLHKEWERGET